MAKTIAKQLEDAKANLAKIEKEITDDHDDMPSKDIRDSEKAAVRLVASLEHKLEQESNEVSEDLKVWNVNVEELMKVEEAYYKERGITDPSELQDLSKMVGDLFYGHHMKNDKPDFAKALPTKEDMEKYMKSSVKKYIKQNPDSEVAENVKKFDEEKKETEKDVKKDEKKKELDTDKLPAETEEGTPPGSDDVSSDGESKLMKTIAATARSLTKGDVAINLNENDESFVEGSGSFYEEIGNKMRDTEGEDAMATASARGKSDA